MPESSSSEVMPRFVRRREGRRAFTLVELLAVLAIAAVLAGLVIAGGRRASETGRAAQTRAELAALSAALDAYKRQQGDYPRSGNAAALLQSLTGRRGPTGELIEARALIDLAHFVTADGLDPFVDPTAHLVDAWGRPYVYAYMTGGGAAWRMSGFVLYSAGPDGAHQPPAANSGYSDASASENADNLYVNAP